METIAYNIAGMRVCGNWPEMDDTMSGKSGRFCEKRHFGGDHEGWNMGGVGDLGLPAVCVAGDGATGYAVDEGVWDRIE
jgi:hypothetical protein